jgi:tRNA(Ile)-lysidine synthase
LIKRPKGLGSVVRQEVGRRVLHQRDGAVTRTVSTLRRFVFAPKFGLPIFVPGLHWYLQGDARLNSMLAALVQRTIVRRSMIPSDQRVLVGVSGGADSVCLLLILRELEYDVSVAHLNHGLRGPESDADEEFVTTLCNRLSVRLHCARVNGLRQRGNVEAEGRKARQAFWESLVREFGYDRIALAHTRNDRVETFMLNLARGAGLDGLTSMEAVSGNVVRPLIDVERAAIEVYLRQRGQAWRDDSSNADLAFARNRMRHEILPRLTSDFNPKLVATVARTIDLL